MICTFGLAGEALMGEHARCILYMYTSGSVFCLFLARVCC